MADILNQIIERKKQEIEQAKRRVPAALLVEQIESAPPIRSFLTALTVDRGVSLIAEVKKASPSRGVIRQDFEPARIAESYSRAGASCVSVLTDKPFFQGRLDYLTTVRRTIDQPVLRKDFIIDSYQIHEARVAGADAVLLIAECLDAGRLSDLHDEIVSLGMTPLVEFFDPANLRKVLDADAQLIGINNRNLETFETDLMHCVRIRRLIPAGKTVVGESGIYTAADVARLAEAEIDAMLVGESLMRSDDIEKAVGILLGRTTAEQA